jgi:hypothetical protein
MAVDKIYNEDCILTMGRLTAKVNAVRLAKPTLF